MNIASIHALFLTTSSVSTDTRKIEKDSFFVALKGTNFNANTMAGEALAKGAKYVVIDEEAYSVDERTILVNDCLATLQELASYHRDYLQLPIIALTGSNGKTTTKELILAVLSKKYATKATVGNLNNHIGVPLTLLSFDSTTEIGIVEMGANHQQEIAFLCELAKPNYGYITNFGKAHLEGFGGVEGVIKGKSEMYDYLSKQPHTVFVNIDDPIQHTKSKTLNRITFGIDSNEGDVTVSSVQANPFVTLVCREVVIHSRLIGLYNVSNVVAAIAMGLYFKVPLVAIKEAIESYQPDNNRSQIIVKGSNAIILDAYNANPSSMEVALDHFSQIDKPNKIAILGDMFELGAASASEHLAIVQKLKHETTHTCFFVGKAFFSSQETDGRFHFFETFDSLAEFVKKSPLTHSFILIKGSRGMALEKILEFID